MEKHRIGRIQPGVFRHDLLAVDSRELVDRIGKILTPVLLLSIAILVGYAAINPMGVSQAAQGDFATHPLVKGILEGYGTMDALASLVFAIMSSMPFAPWAWTTARTC